MKKNGVQNIFDSEAALPRMQPSKATTKRTAHSSISIVMHRNNLKPSVLVSMHRIFCNSKGWHTWRF
jgi:hypothetical protein